MKQQRVYLAVIMRLEEHINCFNKDMKNALLLIKMKQHGRSQTVPIFLANESE